MKKLLALVLVTVMVLSSVATSFAATADSVPTRDNPAVEDYHGNDSDYAVDFWLSDETIAEGATTAKVTLNVKNNIGFGMATMHIIYPSCLKAALPNSGINVNKRDPWDETKALYTTEDLETNLNATAPHQTFINANNNTGFSYNGMSAMDLVNSGEYILSTISFYCEFKYANEDDEDEGIKTYNMNFKDVDCELLTFTFTYDESENPTGKTELPIILLINNTDSCVNIGEGGKDELTFIPVAHYGSITVPAQEVAPCEHPSTHEEIVAEPTCTEAGSKDIVCDECGETIDTVSIDALGHTEEVIPAVAATCTTDGSTEGVKCSVCGEILVAPEVIPAMGDAHVPGEAVIVEATCTDAGSKTVTCTVCGEVLVEDTILAKGHVAGATVILTTPTTETEGAIATKCSVCGEYYDEKELPAVDAYTVSIDDKIVTAGSEVTVAIKLDNPATGSNSFIASPYWSSELNATVVEGDKIFEGQTFDYAPGVAHVIDKNAAYGIDKDYAGLNSGVIAVLPKDITASSSVDGTVAYITFTAPEEAGEYKVGVVLNDDYFTVVPGTSAMYEYEVADRVVEATIKVVEAPTVSIDDVVTTTGEETSVSINLGVSESGLSSFIASPYWSSELNATVVEGDKIFEGQTFDYAPGVAHVIDKNAAYGIDKDYAGLTTVVVIVEGEGGTTESGAVIKINFTPTVPGEYVVGIVLNDDYATVIGEKDIYAYDVANRVIEAKVTVNCGHLETEVIPAVAPTCTETGLTEGLKCSVCDEILTAQEEVPVIAHTEEVIPAVDATCTETGLTAGVKCSVCGEILVAQEEVPALGHTEEEIPAVDATCTETGLTAGLICSVCGEILVAQEEIPALGHAFGEWVVVKEATREEEGLEVRTCERCGETEERAIEKLPALVFPLSIEPGYYANAAECTIDNVNRVINIVSKKNAPEVDFRFLNSTYAYTYVEDNADIKTKIKTGANAYGYLEDGVTDNPTAVRYFMAYAENGFKQSYEITVTKDGESVVYTVNVEFNYGAAVGGIEPGYYADKTQTGLDEADNTIYVVAKSKAPEVDFRPLLANGAWASLTEGNEGDAYAVQKVNGVYTNVTANGGETHTQMKYFYCQRDNGAQQTYGITVHQIDGSTVDYTVVVSFVD